MSYQAKLQIQFYDIKEEQMSPLVFGSQPECKRFGNKMFEPPETVRTWEIVNAKQKANATIKNGKVGML